jgi:hypothetical protein
MTTALRIASAVALLSLAGPAFAACSDDIATLEGKLDSVGRTAGAATSSGQATAADRSQKAIEAHNTGTAVQDLPSPPNESDRTGAATAAQAGGAGDTVMQAKVTLNDARNAEKKGDEAACLAAVAKAKAQISD